MFVKCVCVLECVRERRHSHLRMINAVSFPPLVHFHYASPVWLSVIYCWMLKQRQHWILEQVALYAEVTSLLPSQYSLLLINSDPKLAYKKSDIYIYILICPALFLYSQVSSSVLILCKHFKHFFCITNRQWPSCLKVTKQHNICKEHQMTIITFWAIVRTMAAALLNEKAFISDKWKNDLLLYVFSLPMLVG